MVVYPALIAHGSKVMLKMLQARLQQYVNRELPDVKAGFRKVRGTRDQIANIRCIIEKARNSRKISTSSLLTTPEPLTMWIRTNCGKFFRRWECQTTLPSSWEICIQVKKQQLEPNMEQWSGSSLGKESVKAVYFHPAHLTYTQCTSCEMSGWMKHKAGINIVGRNIDNLSYATDTTLVAGREEELKRLFKVKEESEKAGLKLNIQKTKSMASGPIIFMANRWGNSGNSKRLYFLGLQNHCRWWPQPWNYKILASWKKRYDQPREHIKKLRHYFADKGLSSQSYSFFSSHVWMWVET